MKEFIEKLIGRLEEESDYEPIDYDYCDMSCSDEEHFISTHKSIEIVNQLAEEYADKNCSECSRRKWYQIGYADAEKKLAEEYNNGWISVDDALPEDDKDVWVKYADCERYGIAWYQKNFGWDSEDIQNCIERLVVEAWMPIVPYQPKGE